MNGFFAIKKGLKIDGLAIEPVSSDEGSIYYNTTLFKFREFANGTWKDLGGAGGFIKVRLLDRTSTTLPTGAVTVDGTSVTTGDFVLFTNLSSNNNEIYLANGTGPAIASWTAQTFFENSSSSPSNGDFVFVKEGTQYQESIIFYDGTIFRFFTVNYVLAPIANNQAVPADVSNFFVDPTKHKAFSAEYSLRRRHTTPSVELIAQGTLRGYYKDTTGVWVVAGETFVGDVTGVDFSMTNAGQLQYISDNQAGAVTESDMKFNLVLL